MSLFLVYLLVVVHITNKRSNSAVQPNSLLLTYIPIHSVRCGSLLREISQRPLLMEALASSTCVFQDHTGYYCPPEGCSVKENGIFCRRIFLSHQEEANHFHPHSVGQKELSHMTPLTASKSMRCSVAVYSGGKEISFGDQLPWFYYLPYRQRSLSYLQ